MSEHSCNCVGYSIEAMLTTDMPEMIAGNLVDSKWRTVNVDHVPNGVGVPRSADYHADIFAKLGVMGYEAAQALRWWLHAEAARSHKHWGLRTRLVRHSVSYSMQATPGEAIEEIGGNP